MDDAQDDAEWNALTVADKLHDNHFLCAKIAAHRIPVRFLPEHEFNWQGLRSQHELNVTVDATGRSLINQQTGRKLRLVHFAGLKHIEAFIAALPPAMAAVLVQATSGSPAGVLELMDSSAWAANAVDDEAKMALLRALVTPPEPHPLAPGQERSYVTEAEALRSIASSIAPCDVEWNGLKCGAAYLSAAEYRRLRTFVRQCGIRRVIEFGAGYSSVLFKRVAEHAIAVEGWSGPWLDHARAQGCDARLIPFDSAQGGFEPTALVTAIDDFRRRHGAALVFLDSPQGTANRLLVAEQVTRLLPSAEFYAVHDSIRDSGVVYKLCLALGLTVIEHVDSVRGLTLLGRPGVRPAVPEADADVDPGRLRFAVEVAHAERMGPARADLLMRLRLTNTGADTIPFMMPSAGLCRMAG